MTHSDIQEWKAKLLAPIQAKIRDRSAAAEGAEALRPDTRLAVGYSPQKSGVRLEIRVQRKGGPAWRQAEAARAKYPNEVNVAVIESVEVPTIKAVLESEAMKPFVAPPLRLGSSVSHRDESGSGTLGAFVEDGAGERSVLSCSHVLALSGAAKKKDPIVHPGSGDVAVLTAGNLVGLLANYTVLSRGKANALDAAYAHLDAEVDCLGNAIPEGVGAPSADEGERIGFDPNLALGEDEALAKIGRTTGYTEGILNAMGVDNVSVVVRGIGLIYFDNCIEVRWKAVNQAFTKPGDSGSAIWTTKGRRAIGLHFAAGDAARDGKPFKVSYSCDLAAIMSSKLFNLTWMDDS